MNTPKVRVANVPRSKPLLANFVNGLLQDSCLLHNLDCPRGSSRHVVDLPYTNVPEFVGEQWEYMVDRQYLHKLGLQCGHQISTPCMRHVRKVANLYEFVVLETYVHPPPMLPQLLPSVQALARIATSRTMDPPPLSHVVVRIQFFDVSQSVPTGRPQHMHHRSPKTSNL